MKTAVETTGFAQITQRLNLLQEAVRADGTRRALNAAARVILDAEIAAAPVLDEKTAHSSALDPGVLRDNLGVTVRRDRQGVITAFIGPKRGTGKVAHLVEYGHLLVKGGKNGRREIGHVPPHPYLRPALDASARPALALFAETMKAVWKAVLS